MSEKTRRTSSRKWLVTRHDGAAEWFEARGFRFDRYVRHLDSLDVESGDEIYGTLPVGLAAKVCSRGAIYWHLDIPVPSALRGRELSAEQIEKLNPILRRYHVMWVKG